jgi:TolB protein
LERSGQFLHVGLPHGAWDETSQPDLSPWRSRGVDVVVVGSVNPMAGGRWDVRYRLWDVLGNKSLGGVSYPVSTQDLRAAAHRIADDIFQRMTGVPGVFSTRIAYTTRSGGRHHLWLADADGQNPKSVLSSTEPIISPNWSADGNRLAYVSFEQKKPIVYTHEVATGVRRLASNQRGSNSAPAWSPDGSRLLVTLTLLLGSLPFYIICDSCLLLSIILVSAASLVSLITANDSRVCCMNARLSAGVERSTGAAVSYWEVT